MSVKTVLSAAFARLDGAPAAALRVVEQAAGEVVNAVESRIEGKPMSAISQAQLANEVHNAIAAAKAAADKITAHASQLDLLQKAHAEKDALIAALQSAKAAVEQQLADAEKLIGDLTGSLNSATAKLNAAMNAALDPPAAK